jgi:dTDP-4-amino-4,6-dideoxygalactose transaminase
LKTRANEGYPVAEDAYERLISLPMFHGMTAQDAEDVIHAVRKVVTHYQER